MAAGTIKEVYASNIKQDPSVRAGQTMRAQLLSTFQIGKARRQTTAEIGMLEDQSRRSEKLVIADPLTAGGTCAWVRG